LEKNRASDVFVVEVLFQYAFWILTVPMHLSFQFVLSLEVLSNEGIDLL